MAQQAQLRRLHHARIVASVAATLIALACGTNYVYSAWAPQFAERLHLSSTESNLIGLSGNLGQYTLGVPIGIFVDHRGPRPAVLAGALLLALGYFPLHQAYDRASGSVPLLCFFSYLSGLGGCMAFAAAVKTSALNWPQNRGTATAFPLAAFGLSAFFFSTLGSLFFPGNPSAFLMLLAWGTCSLTAGGFFFLKIHPHSSYHAVPASDQPTSPISLEPTGGDSSDEPKPYHPHGNAEPGMLSDSNETNTSTISSSLPSSTALASSSAPGLPRDPKPVPGTPSEPESGRVVITEDPEDPEVGETTSLLSHPAPLVGDASFVGNHIDIDRSHRVDIRGFKLLRNLEFWQLFSIMGILAGVGIMTINNIGNDAKALWKHYDKNVTNEFLVKQQQLHVSTLSVCSFLGRLSSGVGSDFLVKGLNASRLWCLIAACIVFFIAQLSALTIVNPHLLGFVSSLSGLAYGFLFGVFPSIVAEEFGINGLTQNWGFMVMAPSISSNIFNIIYGRIYDQHSVIDEHGKQTCLEGLDCYRSAYGVTLVSCIVGFATTLVVIRRQRRQYLQDLGKGDEED